MSLAYFVRYRFNNESDLGEEDFGQRDLALETGSLAATDDPTYGKALSLDGASLLATGEFDLVSDDNNRSVCFWAKTTSSPSPVFSFGSLTGPYGFTFYTRNPAGRPEFYNHATRYEAPSEVSAGTWHSYAVTYDSATGALAMFVDGAHFHTAAVGTLTTGNESLRIGTDGEGEFFIGQLLDFRMWDTALSADVLLYIHQRGPNFEEPLDTEYASNTLRTETITGSLLCKTNLGIKPIGEVLFDSSYAQDANLDIVEAARVEYSQNSSGSGVATLKVRHTTGTDTNLVEALQVDPEATTFTARDATDDSTSSVVFSSEGVRLVPSSATSEKGCLIFGKGADFRIRVKDGLFTVEAYSSVTDGYVTKMEIGG